MKKIIMILGTATALAMTANMAQAQTSLRFGVKGGLTGNHANIKTGNASESGFGIGAYAGGLAELSFPRGSKFKLQLEALYQFNRFGFNDYNNVNYVQVLHSVQVPLSVKYFIQPDFSLLAGVSANSHLAGNHKTGGGNSEPLSDVYDLNKIQVGAHIGANYYIKNGFFVEARYNYLFGNTMELKSNIVDNSHQFGMLHLGVGYKFN